MHIITSITYLQEYTAAAVKLHNYPQTFLDCICKSDATKTSHKTLSYFWLERDDLLKSEYLMKTLTRVQKDLEGLFS